MLGLLLATASAAAAQQPLPELSLEELMRIDAGQVFGASERMQPVTEAPASVSFITAEEIARYGYRTLADILRGVRGMYVTDDRNFSLVGTRGFAKPGDYNSRILLLVNGHRVNDNVFGQAEIGAEFGLDPAMFERVEIIRGPASSLYGDSAFFAVVNVITRSGASLDGALGRARGRHARHAAGARQRRPALRQRRRRRAVRHVRAERRRRAAVLSRRSIRRRRTTASPKGSTASGVGQFYGRLRFKRLHLHRRLRHAGGATCRRRRSARCSTSRSRPSRRPIATRSLDVEYGRSFGGTRLTLRGSFDQFSYDGIYPFDAARPTAPTLVGRNSVLGSRWSVGARLTRPLPGRQTLTAGAEFIDNIHQDQDVRYLRPADAGVRHPALVDRSTRSIVQDEIKLASWLHRQRRAALRPLRGVRRASRRARR